MNMSFYQDFNSVYVENYEPTVLIVIHFNGSFDGDMVSRGLSYVRRNKIYLIRLREHPANIVFNYSGNFRISKVFAYTSDKKEYGLVAEKASDEVQRINAEWNSSTSKYTDYNRSNKKKTYRKTILRKRI